MKTVLLIDDDPQIRLLVTRFLAKTEYAVVAVDGIEAAFQEIETGTQFCAALVDFWLGQNDAIPLLDSLRESLPETPIIVISGGDGNVTLEATKAVGEISGAMHFMQKPFAKAELIDVLSSI